MKKQYLYRFFLLVLISAVGIFVVGKLRPEPISSQVQKEKFWSDKVHSTNKYDLIFEGDSRIYRGIDPKSVSKELKGLRVLNFGFSSGGHNELIFKEVENRLRNDKIIVLGLTPYSLTPKAQANKHYLQEKNRSQKDVFNRRFINPLFSFFDPIKPTDVIYYNDTIPGYYERFKKNGWVESRKIPFNPKAALPGYVKDFESNIVSEDVLKNLFEQIEKWIQKDIKVFALRMPTTEEMEKLENELSGFKENEIRKSIEEIGAKWIEVDNRYDYVSYDGSHLDRESARIFSSYIGRKINEVINEK
ncbi:hypothetical protein D1816_16230 [Aquimarina sp. AD10]|uniref:hypothetical protein n=1 Tax=Aquimarina sp. AD10 TaxID=1714849 RepID=UPI000E54392A|nr:hypothetical protein [Aquimarina sp. AD10]AXT61837.1 hypothetical protein D1816_16230 [Aquimarina sp. AD10]RKN02635.1 hypothetical protein D7033_00355 [Aquimarina sp. AD10]